MRQPSTLLLTIVVEEINDVEYLKRISIILARHDPSLPDLVSLESAGQITFVTTGATSICPIRAAVCGIRPPAFDLYDRETAPLTEQHQRVIVKINRRPHCLAVLTRRRSLENYLHPDTIREIHEILISFGPNQDVPEVAARALSSRLHPEAWESLSRPGCRRLRDKARHWLNRDAVDRMTVERLKEHDPNGEVCGWIRAIAGLLHRSTVLSRSAAAPRFSISR